MAKILATAISSCILLSGCSVIRVDEMPMEGSTGAVEFRAIRRDDPDKLTSGYRIRVKGKGVNSGWISAQSSAPCLLPDLRPGPYTVEVRGRGISRKRFEIDVRPGVRTSIAILRKNVKRNERIEEAAEAVAVGTGKAILYTVGFVVYGVIYLTVEGCFGDDDDEDDDEDDDWEPSYRSERSSHRSTPSPAPQGYRSKVRR